MTRLPAVAAALLLTGAACSGAQTASGPAAPTPGVPPAQTPAAQREINSVDRAFLHEAALGGKAEVESGALAGRKAQTQGVKAFADRMQQDHGQANARLAELAGKTGVPLPDELDPDRRAAQARLQQASGASFDALYVANQVQEHQKAVQLFQHEIDAGQNAELRAAAAEKLPILMRHLEIARRLLGELIGAR